MKDIKNITLAPLFYPTFLTPSTDTGVLDNRQMLTLSYFYLVTSLLSLTGSASIVIASVAKKKVFNREVHPIFHLSLADLFGSIVLLAGAISYHALKAKAMYSSHCRYLTGFATTFYMNTFLLTLNYAFSVNEKVKARLTGDGGERSLGHANPSGHFNRIGVHRCGAALLRYGMSWFLPLMITLCLFAIDSGVYGINDNICTSCLPMFHYKNSNCQDTDPSFHDEPDWYSIYKYIFIGILTFSIVGSMALYVQTYNFFKTAQFIGGVISQRQRELLRIVRRRLGLFCVVFLFCWIPSLILGFISLSPSFEMDKFFWLYVIQACTCPLQGFINCIIYGWYRPGFKSAMTEKSPLLNSTSLQNEM